MKIKIPTEIKCGAHIYHVHFDEKILLAKQYTGITEHDEFIIGIEPRLKSTNRDECLIHEILEVVKRIYSIELGHDDLDRMAEGLLDVLHNSFGLEFDWSEIKEV